MKVIILENLRIICSIVDVYDILYKMTTQDDIYFEISDSGNIVKLEPKQLVRQGSELDWDNNWIITTITVKGGKFSGQYEAEFMTIDFEKFKQELSLLYNNLNGSATFNGLEEQLELKIKGDGIGHFEMIVTACDQTGYGGKLKFTMSFDQTSIKELVSQLERITKNFPIVGDFNIKNE